MSRRNSREGKARRRAERMSRKGLPTEEAFPAYLESDEAYLHHVLQAPEAELTDSQRELRDEIRAHHPEVR